MKVEKHVRVKCPFCKQWVGTKSNGTVIEMHRHPISVKTEYAGNGHHKGMTVWTSSSISCEGAYKSIVELEATEAKDAAK